MYFFLGFFLMLVLDQVIFWTVGYNPKKSSPKAPEHVELSQLKEGTQMPEGGQSLEGGEIVEAKPENDTALSAKE